MEKKDFMLTVREAGAILAYGDVQFSRTMTQEQDQFGGGEAQTTRKTLKIVRKSDDEIHFIYEEGMTTHVAVLNKADMVVISALINSSIPYMVGFSELYKQSPIVSDDSPRTISPVDRSIWE
jgi:hypothetical protein